MTQEARRFDAATEGMLRRPGGPPFVGLLRPVLDWVEERHLAMMHDAGFDDVRRAHNSVFAHLPAAGRRLTDLADAAEMSKQAMGELVDDLVDKRYLRRTPDPTDGRAKLIVWAERGEDAHEATMQVFATIEQELTEAVGEERFADLRSILLELLAWVAATPPPAPPARDGGPVREVE